MSEEIQPAWWKPWNWPWFVGGLLTLVLLALMPFAVRTFFLASVPSMAEPFDESAFVKNDPSPEENAFALYEQAFLIRQRSMIGTQTPSGGYPDGLETALKEGWQSADEPVRAWLESNREAMEVWRRGTERERALAASLGKMSFATTLEASQGLRDFARLARLDQLRMLHEGDVDEAWKLARAIYRSGGHVTSRGPLIAALIGVALHSVSGEAMTAWAAHPAVTSDQIRASLAQIKQDFALYESESDMLCSEFLVLRNSLGTSGWIQFVGPGGGASGDVIPMSLTQAFMWVVGEPELTVRMARQILANQIREVDKPLAQRRKLVGAGMAMLFDTDPKAIRRPGELDPAGIDRGLRISILSKLLLPATKQVDNAYLRFLGRQAALEIMLAAQAFRRDKGEFPESLDQLVPAYLETIPADPCHPSGGRLLYRRDTTTRAVVWSVGEDGSDGGGNVKSETGRPADVGFELQASE